MKLLSFAVSVVLCAPDAQAAESRVPADWRLPISSESTAAGESWRDENSSRYLSVQGDFDGDGKPDEALLLVSSDGSQFAVFFHGSTGRWTLLSQSPVVYLQSMGLSLVPPGRHTTACGKGYWRCKKGEPKELNLSNEAILFFAEESASSAFVWSRTRRRFEQVWLSD